MITEAPKLVVEKPSKTRRTQYVFEAKWHVDVDDKEEVVTQLVSGYDFQSAFFKARAWAKSNVVGRLVSIAQRNDMVI